MARDRGKSFEAPDWWLLLARAKVDAHGQLVKLGAELAKIAKRATPYNHSVLSKFANGETMPTVELAEAITIKFDLPRAFYVPQNAAEAEAMHHLLKALTAGKNGDLGGSGAESKYIEQLEQLEGEAERQGRDLDSPDGAGRSGRRGSRRVRGGS